MDKSCLVVMEAKKPCQYQLPILSSETPTLNCFFFLFLSPTATSLLLPPPPLPSPPSNRILSRLRRPLLILRSTRSADPAWTRRAMDDMSGILARDFGIRPQGKAAPMAASKTASTHRSTSSSSTWTSNAPPSYDDFFNSTAPPATANSRSTANQPHDPILDTFNKGPVFDTPVYDDDIFDGVPGVRSSSNMRFHDVFGSGPSDRSHVESPPAYDDLLGSLGSKSGRVDRSQAASPPPYDDLLGGLGAGERKDDQDQGSAKRKGPDLSGFDDLLPGFGSSVPPPQPKRFGSSC